MPLRIAPESAFRHAWHIASFVLFVYQVFSVPLRIAFLPDHTLDANHSAFMVADYLVDAFFAVDILMRLRYFGVAPPHRLVRLGNEEVLVLPSTGHHRRLYLRSWGFAADVVATMPIELVVFAVGGAGVGYYRLNRMFRLLRQPAYMRGIGEVLAKHMVFPHAGVRRMWLLFFTMAMAAHWMCCVMYAVSLREALRGRRSWAVTEGLLTMHPPPSDHGNSTARPTWPPADAMLGDGAAVVRSGLLHTYVRSLYWAVSTMVTVGYGDTVPRTYWETAVGFVTVYIGFFITAACLANLGRLFASLDSAYAVMQQHLDLLDKYLRARRLPRLLVRRVVEFFDHMWAASYGVSEIDLEASLSPALRLQITTELTSDLLRRLPELQDCPAPQLRALATALRRMVVAPGAVVVEQGQLVQGAYLVRQGTLDVQQRNHATVDATVGDGGVISADAVLHPARAHADVVARGYCELYFLPATAAVNILGQLPLPEVEERSDGAALPAAMTVHAAGSVGRQRWEHPDSQFRRAWAVLRFGALAYNAFSVPAQLAYMHRGEEGIGPRSLVVMLANYVVDLFFVADIVLHARYFAVRIDGVVTFARPAILGRYLRSSFGADIAAALPFDALAPVTGTFYLPLLRLLKVARLLHLYQYFHDAEAAAMTRFRPSSALRRLSRVVFVAAVAAHWAACAWILLADLSLRWGAATSWIQRDVTNPMQSVQHGSGGLWLRAMYWVLVSSTTMGYGDIVPTNMVETAGAIVILFFGALLYPAMVGSVGSMLQNMHPVRDLYARKVHSLQWLMRLRGFPRPLREKAMRFADYAWNKQGGVDERAVLESLPAQLLADVQEAINGPALARVPFLRQASPSLLRALLLRLEPELYVPQAPPTLPQGEVVGSVGGAGSCFPPRCTVATRQMLAAPDSVAAIVDSNPPTPRGVAPCEGASSYGRTPSSDINRAKGAAKSSARSAAGTVPADRDTCLMALEGTMGDRLYLIEHGFVQVVTGQRNDVTLTVAGGGAVVGEETLLPGARHAATLRPLTYCMCFSLARHSLEDALALHSHEQDAVLQALASHAAAQRVKWLRVRSNLLSHTKLRYITSVLEPSKSLHRPTVHPASLQHPSSARRACWDAALLLAILYSVVVVPLRLAVPLPPFLLLVDYALDAVLVANMVLSARHFAVLRDGELHVGPKELWSLYRRGSLGAHLIATIPYDVGALFVWALHGTSSAQRIAALLRLPRLLHARQLLPISTRLTQAVRHARCVRANYNIIKLIKLLVAVLLMGHWAACVFYLIARLQGAGRQCSPELLAAGANASTAAPGASAYANNSFGMTAAAYCQWRGTWIQRQVEQDLLPADAGSEGWRYLRALNWAIPTMVVVVIGDVVPATVLETAHVILCVIVGVTMNAVIVDRIASFMASINSPAAAFLEQQDRVERYMAQHAVPPRLRERVRGYLAYVWSTRRALDEAAVLEFLPTTLRAAACSYLRMGALDACPLFATCDTALKQELALRLRPVTLGPGDRVVTAGELGDAMYFVLQGELQVLSAVDECLLATLRDGAFFGETACLLREARTATVLASAFTELYELRRTDLDAAMDKYAEPPALGDVQLPLLDRMLAAAAHIKAANGAHTSRVQQQHALRPYAQQQTQTYLPKLHLTVSAEQLRFVRPAFLPNSAFRQCWDLVCMVLTLYCATSVPFRLAFVTPPMTPWLWAWFGVDVAVCGVFMADTVLRARHFAFVRYDQLCVNKHQIWARYKSSWLWVDLMSAIPWMLAAFPAQKVDVLSACSLPLLLRIARTPHYTRTAARYYRYWRSAKARADVLRLALALLGVVMVNHWCGCMWMIIHRYAEAGSAKTWAIKDGLATYDPMTGKHNVCGVGKQRCYLRALYFTIVSLSSTGYGDIRPYAPVEVIFQICVAILGACVMACVVGSFQAKFNYDDRHGNNALRAKLHSLRQFMRSKQLSARLQRSILAHQRAMWALTAGLCEREVTQLLSLPLRRELAHHAKREILRQSAALSDCSMSIQQRIALVLQLQVYHTHDMVYEPGQAATHLYFVNKGLLHSWATPEYNDSLGASAVASRRPSNAPSCAIRAGAHFGVDCVKGLQPLSHHVERAGFVARTRSPLRLHPRPNSHVVREVSDVSAGTPPQWGRPTPPSSPLQRARSMGGLGGLSVEGDGRDAPLHVRAEAVQALECCELYLLSVADLTDVLKHMPRYTQFRLASEAPSRMTIGNPPRNL